MRINQLVILIVLLWSSSIHAKQLAITFDDTPSMREGYFNGLTRTQTLINELDTHDIHRVTFFANSRLLNEEGVKRITQYSNAGHFIANHTHDHANFNTTTVAQFTDSFLMAHQQLSQFENYLHYFRFPYLSEGNTLQKRDAMKAVLQAHGYKNAYITLNNFDWHIENLFQQAITDGHRVDLKKLKLFYIEVMTASIGFYDELAMKYLKRSPKHVLLMHETDVAALFVGDLIEALRQDGWQLIDLEDAYSDPISDFVPEQAYANSPGRVAELAIKEGFDGNSWPKELNLDYLSQKFQRDVLGIKGNVTTTTSYRK